MIPPSHALWARGDALILQVPSLPPYTTPSLTANLVCRVTLSFISNLVCLGPLRMLYRNGEFSAVVLILVMEFKNLETIVDSLLWSNNDTASWWPGYGLCDLDPYFQHFCLGLFLTCLLTINRNIAQQVGLLRASPLTRQEKRRRNMSQALIMFPLPVAQLALTWPLTAQRYAVGTLAGCLYMVYPSWLYMVFFVILPLVVMLLTVAYAALAYVRFRQVARSTESALCSNRAANRRAQRTKRRLYLMIVSIMVPFAPITIIISVLNIVHARPIGIFSYDKAHNHETPYPWNAITYVRSENLDFAVLNYAYISIITTIPVFWYFGMTKDAINDYRKALVFLGLAKSFPSLRKEYDPDRGPSANSSMGSSTFARGGASNAHDKLSSFTLSRNPTSSASSNGGTVAQLQSLDFITSADLEAGEAEHLHRPGPVHQGPNASRIHEQAVLQDPFPLRTRLGFFNPLRLQIAQAARHTQPEPDLAHPLHTLRRASIPNHWVDEDRAPIQTRVWSPEEAGQITRGTPGSSSTGMAAGVRVETALVRESHQTEKH